MNTPHQPKPSNTSKPASSDNDSDGNDKLSPEEIYPQAESAIGRAQRVAPAWDYEAYPDGRIPYC